MDIGLVSLLEKALPACSLIYGTGIDFSIPRYLVKAYEIPEVDYLEREKLLVRDVKTIKRISTVSPHGKFKLVATSLKDSSTSALNSLLILLESPPPNVKFLFLSDEKVLPTLESRCAVFESVSSTKERDFVANAYYLVEALESGNKSLLDELLKNLDGRTAHQVAKILGDKATTSKGALELLLISSSFHPSSLTMCFKSFLPSFLGRI